MRLRSSSHRSASGRLVARRISIKQLAAGYSLMEMLVSLFVLSLVILGTLTLLDSSNRLAVNTLNRSEMQQTIRVVQRDMVQKVRMLGRGGMPSVLAANAPITPGLALPQGLAVSLRNNVGSGETAVVGGTNTVLENTDVLTIRGVFNTPVYLIDYADETSFNYDGTTGEGTVIVDATTPLGNLDQNLDALAEVIGDPGSGIPAGILPEAILLVSPFDERVFAVVELDVGNSQITVGGDGSRRALVAFRTIGGTHANDYSRLSSSGRFPENKLPVVGTLAILEEYTYYIRDMTPLTVPSDSAWVPSHRLSRAQVYPGTVEPYESDANNLTVDIAENILDLQVAIGVDIDDSGVVEETADGTGDEWLFNSPSGGADGPTDAPFSAAILADPSVNLRYLRLSTLARSESRAPNHISPIIQNIEDRDYVNDEQNDPSTDPAVYKGYRLYQRAVLQTVAELRNM